MRRAVLFACLLLSLVAAAQKKKKNNFPQIIVKAQFVYVTSWHGDLYDVRNLTPEDRQAIVNVQDAITRWQHYRVVHNPQDADITIIVRPGARAMLQGGLSIPTGGPIPPSGRMPGQVGGSTDSIGIGGGPFGRAEAGNPNDELLVSLGGVTDPSSAPFLWRRSAKDGLNAPKVALMEAFKHDVEEAEKP